MKSTNAFFYVLQFYPKLVDNPLSAFLVQETDCMNSSKITHVK